MSFPQIVPNGIPPSDQAAENVAIAAAHIGVLPSDFSFETCYNPVCRAIGAAVMSDPSATAQDVADRLGLDSRWADHIAALFEMAPTPAEAMAAAVAVTDAWRLRELIDVGRALASLGTETALEGHGIASRASVFERLTSAMDRVGSIHARLDFVTRPKPLFLAGPGVLVHLLPVEVRCLAASHGTHGAAAETRGDPSLAQRFYGRAAQLRGMVGEVQP